MHRRNGQTCTIKRKPFRCDQAATSALQDKIGARLVECQPKELDVYGRVVSVCFVEGEDINAWMVAKGWALAYRHYSLDYVSQEHRASIAKLGIWRGEFEPPWDWRQKSSQSNARLQADENEPKSARPKDCVIKERVQIQRRHNQLARLFSFMSSIKSRSASVSNGFRKIFKFAGAACAASL
jgi:hypothetical protein